ncbi:MAG: DMT family transporter [bacterium]|nr:DMT family transporter [bacterium]
MSSAVTHRLQILICALLFSTGGAAIKAASLTAWQVAGLRSGFAFVTLLLLMPSWRRGWRRSTVLVGAVYAATMILYVVSNRLTTAANSIFLQSTAPMYLLLFGPWLLGERARRSDYAFTAIMALGLGLFFVGSEPAQQTAPDPFRGNLFAVACGLSWALTIAGLRLLAKRNRDEAETGRAVLAGNAITCLVCLPLAFPLADVGLQDWAVVSYLGVFQIGLAYVAMTRGVKHLPALEISLLLLIEPVLAAVWAWLVHGEAPGGWSLAGCAVILGTTVARTLRRD